MPDQIAGLEIAYTDFQFATDFARVGLFILS